jgi:mortality factor 4-like protein 1
MSDRSSVATGVLTEPSATSASLADATMVDASAATTSTSASFKVGDRILATHGTLRYVAKILEVDEEQGYFVHYDGWNKKWDEWITLDRMFEDNEENRIIAQRLKEEHINRSTKRVSSSTSNSGKRKKNDASSTANDDGDDEKDDENAGGASEALPAVKLNLPEDLKTFVIRDWENLTQKNKICNLPKSQTVVKILADFAATKKKAPVFAQICEGLSVYFDRALPTILLYRVERPQYERLRSEHPDKRNCELYGGEHLLRLFVRLPQLLSNTELDEIETKQLCARLQDLLRFVSKNVTEYFGGGENDGIASYIPYVPALAPTSASSIEVGSSQDVAANTGSVETK